MDDDARYMKRALRLARRGEGYVEPNPMVGCVIVRDERIVGEGWHHRFGGAHAEVEALEQAGAAARGATVYVTLEPCMHEGQTPPCAQALVAAGVRRVVIGCADPNDMAAGGAERLRQAGVSVEIGVRGDEAAELIAPFAKRTRQRLPYVIAKWAQTLDGAIATSAGHSRWVSGAASRRLVHRLRGRVDAVMVGVGTVLADDPELTAREGRPRRIARRVVVDPHLRMPLDGRLAGTLDVAPLTVAATADGLAAAADKADDLRRRGVELVELPAERAADGLADLRPLMHHLATRHEATRVLAEGGARLHAALFGQGLADEAMVFVAGRLLGDGRGLPPLRLPEQAPGRQRVDQGITLTIRQLRRVGEDVLIRAIAGQPPERTGGGR